MIKQKQNSYTLSKVERKTLVACSIIMAAFVLFVSIATQGSLVYYTALHTILLLVTLGALFINGVPKVIVRIAMVLGLIGVVTAIWLIAAYLPYYTS
jgi:hypothetical protein